MDSSSYSLADLATATGANDGFGSGSWIVLILLFAMIYGGGGFLGGSANGATQADIQRAVDLNSIQEGQASINSNVQRVAYENMSAIKDAQLTNLQEIRDNGALITSGNANIINNLSALQNTMQNCCCETKSMILENRYLDAQNTASINANTTAQTQKILDAIAQNKIEELQAKVNQLETQNMFCGIPRISNYAYGVYPYATSCGNNAI